ncbi:MAG: UDP-N-acetylmuramate dehydrogenase, partial [Candidatus Omnitrophica bacterium]|nr:UDP-N-acetylmuramate dehydrogenase [Candidatus Omnitrophota bacterium]
GRHNVMNLVAACGLALEMGLDFKGIQNAVEVFKTVKRRFYRLYTAGGIDIFEDYAHHPTEIKAVIHAARSYVGSGKLIVVFQPHRYTRTNDLADEFAECFYGADVLTLTDIYAADELPFGGKDAKYVYDKIDKARFLRAEFMRKNSVVEFVVSTAEPGDTVILMAAGDINLIAGGIAKAIEEKNTNTKMKLSNLTGDLVKGLLSELSSKSGGKVCFNEPLGKHSSIGIGGEAAAWYEPSSSAELMSFVETAREEDIGFKIVGAGSNILFSDSFTNMVFVKLSAPDFNFVRINGNCLTAGAGTPLGKLIAESAKAGLSGFEGMVGIPGTVGGAIEGNAGYKVTISDKLISLKVVDGEGAVRVVNKKDLNFSYRVSSIPESWIVLEAVFNLEESSSDAVSGRIKEFMSEKILKQPLDDLTLGCVFKNPGTGVLKTGQLIDMAGLKGLKIGGAVVSEKHANFIVNSGGATSKDIRALIKTIKEKVNEKFDVDLELEIEVL